jgi:hypothetical protein
MLKNIDGNQDEFMKEQKQKPSDGDASYSVQQLSGMLHRKERKAVSIEEMNAAIARARTAPDN